MLILVSIACSPQADTTADTPASLASRFGVDLNPVSQGRSATSGSSWSSFGDSADSGTGDTARPTAPMAQITADQTGSVGDTISFDGTGSFDPEGGTLTYAWSLEFAPGKSFQSSGDIADRYTDAGSFVADTAGTYGVALVVTNEAGVASQPYYASATISGDANSAPVADAGADRTVYFQHFVNLLATDSTDANDDDLAYAWSFVSVPASSALTAADWVTTVPFHGSFLPDVEGDYEVELRVEDDEDSDTDSVTVTVLPESSNTPPYVDVGPPQFVALGDDVTIDGTGSYDPDSEAIISWSVAFTSVPAGSALTDGDIAGASSQLSGFTPDVEGEFLLEVQGSDGTDTQVIEFSVNVAGPSSPVVDAGLDQSVPLGVDITVCSSSYHNRGETMTAAWTLTSAPSGSSLTSSDISDASSTEAGFSPDTTGAFVFQLAHTDSDETVTDSVTMTIF
ncbi:MAG: hypothetical protein GY913_15530 [Proteobacteria bacterium]|nr:hypothetical protein [Pseudomonadota bacterium]MCP4918320.1 hypothetical protein [Pseudomonadota bacterium]